MMSSKGTLRFLALLALSTLVAACGDGPVEPGSEWIVGAWKFEVGNCWPDVTLSPETLGYALELGLDSDGRAEIRHDGHVIDRQQFTTRTKSVPSIEGPYLIVDFERDVIAGQRSFAAYHSEDSTLTLSDYGVEDGCAFLFRRIT